MQNELGRIPGNAHNGVTRQRSGTRYTPRLRHQGPLLFSASAGYIRLNQWRQMELSSVLDIEGIGHERQYSVGATKFRQTALFRGVVHGRETPRWPACGRRGGLSEFIH